MTKLSNEQLAAFDRDGFLKLPSFVDPRACDELRERALELVRQHDPAEFSSVFASYIDSAKQASQEYIRGSADSIRFFFEDTAFDEQGNLKYPKERSLCKIGHAIHDCDATFDRFSRTRDLADVASSIGFERPLIAQSMFLFKHPKIGTEIACHQDASYILTTPSSVVGFWFALEDATIENGAMWALPGGHKGPLKSRFARSDGGEKFTYYDQTPFPLDEFVPLEATKGTLILLHGYLPHMSKPNHSDVSRHAYTLHVIEGNFEYPSDNWLLRPQHNPFRGFETFA